jgi:hypothetical protein
LNMMSCFIPPATLPPTVLTLRPMAKFTLSLRSF